MLEELSRLSVPYWLVATKSTGLVMSGATNHGIGYNSILYHYCTTYYIKVVL